MMRRSTAWFAVPVALLATTMLASSAPEGRFPADAATFVAMMGPDDVVSPLELCWLNALRNAAAFMEARASA